MIFQDQLSIYLYLHIVASFFCIMVRIQRELSKLQTCNYCYCKCMKYLSSLLFASNPFNNL